MSEERRTLIWGHRGASGLAPENTLAAFELAAERGADGVELDVQRTRDGVLVVVHDETIDRTSDGSGWVKDWDFADLRALNFNQLFPDQGPMQIPTLQEVYELLRPTDLTINVELKTGIVFYEGIERQVAELTHACGMEGRVIYSSFNHSSVLRMKEADPGARTGFLYADGTIGMPDYAKKYGVDALHPALYNLQYPGFVQECHEKGIEVNVWTVNEEKHKQLCIEAGVHAIITNWP